MKAKTLIIASFLIASLHAQEKPEDPYRSSKATAETPAAEEPEDEPGDEEFVTTPPNISICYEAFSLPLAMAAGLQREQLTDSALYAKMVAGLGDESVRQEIIQVVRACSGQKATTESISEHIYATEYEPAGIINSATNAPKEPKADAEPGTEMASGARTPATPTAFEIRNVGNSLELEPTLSDDNKIVHLRMIPEQVTLVGRTTQGQGLSTTEMPEFEKQSINNSSVLRINQPFLLGTNSRPPASKVDPDSANRVWFAFVTATLAKP